MGLVLVIGQSILGGAAVLTELETYVVMIHMAMAQALLACFILIALDAWLGFSRINQPHRRTHPGDRRLLPLACCS